MYVQSKALEVPLWRKLNTRTIFFIVASLLVFLFVSYAYLVNKTIMNVVAREKTEKTYQKLSASIGDLEAKYLTAKSGVTIDLAYSKGFKDAHPQFVKVSQNIAYNSIR
jgi:hypothetical protein